ncbi:MAG TPA: AtpZ/AtpI family protein [Chloroflexi bacterium]|nr:AtpZ/AtpI family protein [Chloroflexota bacterium]
MSEPQQEHNDKNQYTSNLALAAVSGQVGCLTLVIIFVALLGGLWLDSLFQTKPLFTIILLIASVPVDVIAMLWVVRKATGKIKSVPKDKS